VYVHRYLIYHLSRIRREIFNMTLEVQIISADDEYVINNESDDHSALSS
jgi:hypothetical protein